jgi:mono/diheme cytochrome c family protein
LFCLAGCGETPTAAFKLNSVELLKQEKLFLSGGQSYDERYAAEIGTILTAFFGTPDQPRVPTVLPEDDPAVEVLSQENLDVAAGPVLSEPNSNGHHGRGLYREHCAHCHGITGDGAGQTARSLNPYPRDFRLGKFKFKSTPLRSMPTDDDMMRLLVKGIPGSSMPSFRGLPESDLEALVDYVKYLTIRGQYERYLMSELSNLEDGEPLINLSAADVEDEGDPAKEKYLDSMFDLVGEGLVEDVVERWIDTDDNRSDVPEAPAALLLDHPDHQALVDQGRVLYYTGGNCAQCHGESVAGNGQTNTFDDWTNEWIKSPGVDPFSPETYADFTAAGALPPRPILPRNLTSGEFRGGGQPSDLYLRIANGIEGTPMPAAATLNSDQIWALVAYVKALPFIDVDQRLRHKPVNEHAIAK